MNGMHMLLRRGRLALVVCGAVLAGAAACTDDAPEGSETPGTDDVDSGTPDAIRPSTCAPVTGEGTKHSGNLETGQETWTAAASPHVIDFPVTIREGETLTIEPCAVVRIRKDMGILVQGTLVAEGAEGSPITIERADANDPWRNIETRETATVRLAHATIEGGGARGNNRPDSMAMLDVRGDVDLPPAGKVHLDHVTLSGSASVGLILREAGALTATSTDLTITGGANAPVRSWANLVGSIPSGRYTGNESDEILIDGMGSRDAIKQDMTLANRGVPYHVLGAEVLVGDTSAEGKPKATLTIEAGVTVRFAKGSRLAMDAYKTDKPATGALRAVGTEAQPIVFTSAEATPAPGNWVGLTFKGTPDANNRIEHAKIAYAGGDSGISSYDCPNPDKASFSNYGAIIVYGGRPASAFVTHTSFEQSAGDGIVRGWTGEVVDFLPTNSFAGMALCNQSYPKPVSTTCPNPPPCPKN
ncbi:MAG: hypothetical protein BGO98_17740 [Myxococcales bacterium 68-20]|nr:MAG: hypothetical protein BGO98_17740 [Myxococcales bacterium 68-20]